METEEYRKEMQDLVDDHIAHKHAMLRLQIAAQIVPGIIAGSEEYFFYHNDSGKSLISKEYPDEVARVAFIFADALIAESQKGGKQ